MPVALMSRDSFVSWAWKGREVICLDPSLTEAIAGPAFRRGFIFATSHAER